jgi:hypothetical protein
MLACLVAVDETGSRLVSADDGLTDHNHLGGV